MYCPNCHDLIPNEAQFCPHCGMPVSSAVDLPARQGQLEGNTPAGQHRDRSRSAILLTVVVAVAVVALVGLLLLLRRHDPKADALEALQTANGGVLPELVYDDDGSLKAIRGVVTKKAVRTAQEAEAAVTQVAPLFEIDDETLTYAGVEIRDDGTRNWWFAINPEDEREGVKYITDEDGGSEGVERGEVPDDDELMPEPPTEVEKPTPEPQESAEEVLAAYLGALDIHDYEMEYQWQGRGGTEAPTFRWLLEENLTDETPIGAIIRDFDHDDQDELLVVRWRDDGSLGLGMVEVVDGEAVESLQTTDFRNEGESQGVGEPCETTTPFYGVGCLDVLCDDEDGIIVQRWAQTVPIGDGRDWSLCRYVYEGYDEGLTLSGAVQFDETDMPDDPASLVDEVAQTGTPTDALQMEDIPLPETAMLADGDSTLQVVTRMWAIADDGFDDQEPSSLFRHRRQTAAWVGPAHLGQFAIEAHVVAAEDQDETVQDFPARYEEGDEVTLEGDLVFVEEHYILKLYEPIDAFYGSYPNELEPSWHEGITSVEVVLDSEDYGAIPPVESCVVNGVLRGSSKRSGAHLDEDGSFVVNGSAVISEAEVITQ